MKIKKPILLFSILILIANHSKAQSFNVGDKVGGIGIGIGGSYSVFNGASQSPGFGIFYDQGVTENVGPGVIGVGAYVGHKSFRRNYAGGYRQRLSYTIVGARGTYHWQFHELKELDTYAGLMLAMNFASYRDNSDNYPGLITAHYGSYLSATLFVGARYYFTPQVAAFAEVGYGIAYLTLGAAFKF